MACTYQDAGNQATTTSGNKTATSLASIAGLRPAIYEFTIGAAGPPNSTDCDILYTLQSWTTSAGTSTAFTPYPTDPGFQAAKAACGTNFTAEPTYTANAYLWGPMGINQRATYRWVAAPGMLLTLVGTATTGAGMEVQSPNYATQTNATLYHQE